jgi:hypothetical protein
MVHHENMTARTLVAFAALLPALLLVACNGDDDDATPTTAPSTTAAASSTAASSATAPSSATAAATATAGPFQGSTDAVAATPPAGLMPPVVQGLRAAAQSGFDRLVFEFSGSQVPGYSVQYSTTAVSCGSGQDVTNFIGGGSAPAAMLIVDIRPADGHDASGTATIPRDLTVGLSTLQRAFGICDFEADVTYAVALSAEKPFHVSTLTNPPRLVIDIAQ